MILKTGDKVTIELADQCYRGEIRRAEGFVYFGSGNGKSLMLAFEAVLDGHVGMMPVLQGDDGQYRSLMTENVITVTRIES